MRVMLVDDEEWCLGELADLIIKVGGIEIVGAYSVAAEALNAAMTIKPDIVFIDVQMPGMTGLDLAHSLKKKLKKVYVVLISEKECFARNGFDIGVDDYVLKPFRKERIIKSLERVEKLY